MAARDGAGGRRSQGAATLPALPRDYAEFLPVAERYGELAAYAWAHQGPVHLRAGRSVVRLDDLFVAPAWRRQSDRPAMSAPPPRPLA